MCYHKSLTNSIDYLADYYSVSYSNELAERYMPHYHENGFDFLPSPVISSKEPTAFQLMNWGLIPWWVKSLPDGLKLRTQTLNCISEEMFDKPSFRDAANNGQRCLIPCTGFFEWRWIDEKGKMKIPYYITLQDQPLFSIAGLFSTWKDKQSDLEYRTYTVLTTKANTYMEKIHNSKKRMPVILPREFEKDWLNANLTREDVLALCRPIDQKFMKGYTISKLITSKKEETDIPAVLQPESYADVKD